MSSILSKTIATVYCLILLSCSNSESNKAIKGNELDIEATIKSISKSTDSKGENKCLLEYQLKYDEILSEEEVLNAVGFDKQKLTTEYSKYLKDPKFHGYEFKFDNGRVGKIPGTDRVMEQSDYIRVKFIEDMSLTNFQYNYRVPTGEETQATQQILADVVDGNVENEAAEAALKQAEEKNIRKDTIKKTGSTLIDAFSEIAKSNINVDNLGDAAVWNSKTFVLVVLKDGVKFEVEANASNDMERNKEIAISLAKIILDKCK